jgi:hypothetical protein
MNNSDAHKHSTERDSTLNSLKADEQKKMKLKNKDKVDNLLSKETETKTNNRNQLKRNLLIFGMLNLAWFLFRSGPRPSRVVYPCQRVAANNISLSFAAFVGSISLSGMGKTIRNFFSGIEKPVIILTLILIPLGLTPAIIPLPSISSQNAEILITPQIASNISIDSSDIFVVNGMNVSHVDNLTSLMDSQGLKFYKSENVGIKKGPDGLIASGDVVLLKINCQWAQRGGTNTDLLKEIIQSILNHPDGFTGEIIVTDNGQGRGSMEWGESNSETPEQSTQDVVSSFEDVINISAYLLDDIRSIVVQEFSEGDYSSGYIVNDTPDFETGIIITYPKIQTIHGTNVSLKEGIWNGSQYEDRLRIINLPVLKSHSGYGVTAAMKNYMGVVSTALSNSHNKVATGGMGTIMAEIGVPTLTIIDSLWINANPYPSLSTGPGTSYNEAIRVNILAASTDPVALSFWSAKNILIPAAKIRGYTSVDSIDPTKTTKGGLSEAFGVWLPKSLDELTRVGYNFTLDEEKMNVYVDSQVSSAGSPVNPLIWVRWALLGITCASLITVITIRLLKKKNISLVKKNHE